MYFENKFVNWKAEISQVLVIKKQQSSWAENLDFFLMHISFILL